MKHFRKRKTGYHFKLTNSEQASAHGGQVLIDTLCRRFGLWEQVAKEPLLDARKRKSIGYDPETLVAQLIFTLSSGGVTLADAGRMGQDKVLLELVGMDQAADESTLREWLRAQTPESVLRLVAINAAFVRAVLAEAKPSRICHGGELEFFFDDTQIEVYGKKIEGARINYEGNLALSWQTLWAGPFLLDGILDGTGDVSEYLAPLLGEHAAFWKDRKSYLYADSASSAGKYLKAIGEAGFTHWSVSYNKWTQVLDRLAADLPEKAWSEPSSDQEMTEQYAWVRHTPGEMEQAQWFAVCRWKQGAELFWRYAYVACESDRGAISQSVFERHRLKGAKEQGFSQVLSDLDLHHPPCLELIANQAFYVIATLAHNVLTALKVLDLPDETQGWRIRTIIRHLLTVPVTLSMHARYRTARICIPAGWLRWWRLFFHGFVPRRKRGETIDEDYSDSA